MAGAHIQDSSALNFNYVISEIAAGGYVGEMIPGDVADVLDYNAEEEGSAFTDLFSGVLDTDDLLQVVEAFVPTVYNSRTTCIPCGGAVRAQSPSDGREADIPVKRGFAGGFVGHDAGAQIWGNSDAPWMSDRKYGTQEGEPKRPCDAVRIRSVYGAEFAGGYVGLMEVGSTAGSRRRTSLAHSTRSILPLKTRMSTVRSNSLTRARGTRGSDMSDNTAALPESLRMWAKSPMKMWMKR